MNRILCETIKEFIGKIAGLHSAEDNSSLASGDESIGQKCRILNEKLDQLLGTLHEEASPVHAGSGASLDDEDTPNNVESSVRFHAFLRLTLPLNKVFLIHSGSTIRNDKKFQRGERIAERRPCGPSERSA